MAATALFFWDKTQKLRGPGVPHSHVERLLSLRPRGHPGMLCFFFLLFQAKIDVLLVGNVAAQPLADTVQRFFSSLAEVTVTVGDMQAAAELLAQREFHLVFLRMTSPAAGEQEAARSLR